MKKQICSLATVLASFLFAISALAQSANPSQIIEGASLAEKQVRWVWAHRNDFIKACAMSDCIKQEPAKTLLPQLAKVADRTSTDQLQFKSERANPDFFSSNLGESHRIAMTSQKVGSDIYFNTDLIGSLSMENMVAILFHEWSHHLGLADDAQRLPDQLGAAIAKVFKANLRYTPFSTRNGFQLASGVFQFPMPKETLQEKFFFTNFGFFSDGETLLDTDFGNFSLVAGCDKQGYKIGGQASQTPRWRDAGMKNGVKQVRLSMIMVNACYLGSNGRLVDLQFDRRGYHFDIELDQQGRFQKTSQEFLADALAADLEFITTLELQELKYAKSPITVGEIQTIVLKVKSYTDLTPQVCDFGLSGENPAIQGGGYPSVTSVPNCKVKDLGNRVWEISVSFKISANTYAGKYFPRMIKVDGIGTVSSALLLLPEENGFEVINSNVTAKYSVKSVQITNGLKRISKFGAQAITNSYEFSRGQKIELQIVVNSSSPVRIKGLDTYTLANVNNELQAVHNSGSFKDFVGFNFKEKILNSGNGTYTIILEFTVPDRFNKTPIYGISIQGIFLEDEAFQQNYWKASGPFDYMFIEQSLVNSNR
jgi:hypothetical protein